MDGLAKPSHETLSKLVTPATVPGLSVLNLVTVVRSLRDHHRSETAGAVFALARAAAACDSDALPQPVPDARLVDQHTVDNLITECATALHAFGDERSVELLRRPLGQDGDADRQARLRSSIVHAAGENAFDWRVLEEIAGDNVLLQALARRWRLEDEKPPIDLLLAEWRRGLPDLVAGAEFLPGGGSVCGHATRRWMNVDGYLTRHAPRALAAVWVEFARGLRPALRGRALVFYREVVSLDPEAGPAFLRALKIQGRPAVERSRTRKRGT